MQKWLVAAALISLAGCKKNAEIEGNADAEFGPADLLKVRVSSDASWTAVKATCSGGSFSQVYPLEGGEAVAADLPGEDCLVELMPGAVRVDKDLGPGASFDCKPAEGGGADCADAYADALLIEVHGGDFKSVHVECPSSGYDKRAVLENKSAVLHGLAKDCKVSLNPGEVPTQVTVYRGQKLTCFAERSAVSECSIQ